MTMSFSTHERYDQPEDDGIGGKSSSSDLRAAYKVQIIQEKIRVPDVGDFIARPRIEEILERSMTQFSATLISGRAGTGKTVVAVSFAAKRNGVTWYSVDAADIQWSVFASHFIAGLRESGNLSESPLSRDPASGDISPSAIADFLLDRFPEIDAKRGGEPSLIVLDDLHHIFDAPWFCEFFNVLMLSLPRQTHLVLLCRSKPPNPIWRLRSKQVLNVIDEKLLAFTTGEAIRLYDQAGLDERTARNAHAMSFGRITGLLQAMQRLNA